MVIWFVVIWITTDTFTAISFAFQQDSRTTKAPRRNPCEGRLCDRSIAMDPMRILLKNEDNRSMKDKTPRDTNSFVSISTRIYMAGPVLDGEECGFVAESFGGASGITGNCCKSLAHGILCPETVTKMEQNTEGGRNNRVVKAFFDRYHLKGPMSCMELLSDPEILPHLTMAMRNLA